MLELPDAFNPEKLTKIDLYQIVSLDEVSTKFQPGTGELGVKVTHKKEACKLSRNKFGKVNLEFKLYSDDEIP